MMTSARPTNLESKGFTLVELLVVLAIFAILSFAAVPFFKTMLDANDISTAKNTLVYTLNKAKRIATAQNTFVELEFSNNQISMSVLNEPDESEQVSLPSNIIFPNQQVITFGANGVIVTGGGDSINSDTNITLQNKTDTSKQEVIAVTTTGMVAEL